MLVRQNICIFFFEFFITGIAYLGRYYILKSEYFACLEIINVIFRKSELPDTISSEPLSRLNSPIEPVYDLINLFFTIFENFIKNWAFRTFPLFCELVSLLRERKQITEPNII